MPITPFLRNQAFDPELIEAMGAAFQNACTNLGLADRADPMTELVAKRIIELAQRGMRTSVALYTQTVDDFKVNPL